MTLAEWHQKLHGHFTQLRCQRNAGGRVPTVFALEHGLASDELAALQQAVRAEIGCSPLSVSSSLPWIVYATEIGYRYIGNEYWQTFEAETPGWAERGARGSLRDCFIDFHRCYEGAKPTGRWAERFSIICWPITHAVLPRDLQRRLARMLYDIRHEFSETVLRDASILGSHLAARGWAASPRFEQLAGQPQAIGRIALALLLRENREVELPILRSTADRIAKDLEATSALPCRS